MNTPNTSHLEALTARFRNEQARLSAATSEGERKIRAVWVAQIEREIESEKEFLGITDEPERDFLEKLTEEDHALLDALSAQ